MDLKEKTWSLIDDERLRFSYPADRLNLKGQQRLIMKEVAHKVLAQVFKQMADRYEKGLC